jgi:ABC-2 type transport system ATP-binding protein
MSAVVDRTLPAVEVAGLTKAYGGRTVVRDLSFRIAAGEILALLGPNGAGKTTTVEIVEGYRRPDRGSVSVLGVDPAAAGRDHRARVGVMLQGGGGIEPRMTAREVLRLHARFHATPRDPEELLRAVGLSGDAAKTRFRRLSGGERQRLSLALALVGRPAVAILDEPTAGMDV